MGNNIELSRKELQLLFGWVQPFFDRDYESQEDEDLVKKLEELDDRLEKEEEK